MESEIRGLIEKEIEHITRIDILEGFAEATQKDFPTKSMKDCLFGIIGKSFSLVSTVRKHHV